MSSPIVLDLFCGCGGFSSGLVKAGFEVVAGIDIWDKAIESYKKNHIKTVAICEDLTSYPPERFVNETGITSVDMIVGGPPCQGFSLAGRRDPSDPRNSLFMEYAKYIAHFRPRAFLMENVPGILSMKTKAGEKVINIILQTFQDIGYKVSYQILRASDYEVPQIRRRIFFFGQLPSTSFTFPPSPVGEEITVGPLLLPREECDEKLFLSERALTGIARKKEEMKKKGHGFGAQFIDVNKPCYTIPARYWKDGYDALVKYDDGCVRRLSILELKRVQSFPDDYVLVGSKKEVIMQIGNAVASRLGYHLGKHLIQQLS